MIYDYSTQKFSLQSVLCLKSQYHQLCWWFGFALPGRIAFPPEGGLTNHSFSYWWPLKSGSFLLF